jgi:signal transduction histidine kinase/ligand-binding sensor domain-containing protein
MDFLKIILIGVFILFPFVGQGQQNEIRFKHITTNDGLSQSWVRCFCQDSFGFIWIGTDNGLNRFDGHNFVIYKHNPLQKRTISNSGIRTVFEDRKGNLWIGTFQGLDLYDRDNDRFIPFDRFLNNAGVNAVTGDDKGNLWIGSDMYLYYYNTHKDSIIFFSKEKDRISNNCITALVIDKKKNIWAGTKFGLNLFDRQGKFIRFYAFDPRNKASISSNIITALFEDSKGNLWVGTDKGLDVVLKSEAQSEKVVFTHFQYSPSNKSGINQGTILSLMEDVEHNLWIGTENTGLNRLNLKTFNPDNPVFERLMNNPARPASLSNNSVYALYQDKQLNLWVGTYSKGIDMYSKSTTRFTRAFQSKEKGYALSSNYVNVFFEEKKFLWLGTDGGLNRVDKKTGKITSFLHDPFNPQSISSNWVHAIFKDSKGNLWIGTWGGGVNKFNYNSETFLRFVNNPKDSTSIQSNNIFAIYEDSSKNLWLGSMGGGLILFDTDKQSFRNFTLENSQLTTNYISSITSAGNHDLWLITTRSLEKYTPFKKTKAYIHNPKNPASISSDKIICTYRDKNGNLWVGTDIGLNVLNIKTDKFTHYSIEDGLPDNTIKAILGDDHGNLWLSSNKGISKFINATEYPNKPIFKNYTVDDGLHGLEFIKRACLKDANGGMYFGGSDGISFFYPDSIQNNNDIAAVRIIDFLVFNKPLQVGAEDSLLKQNIYLTKKVELSYLFSTFTVKYVALNYISPGKNQYAYKLEGFDKDWNYVGNVREATYMNLSSGNYIFKVKASNNDGVWNETGASIQIRILPPWWATWWFKALIFSSIAILILTIYYVRLSLYRKKQRELSFLVQQRTKELEITNKLLVERQLRIEEQSAKLVVQTESLKQTNDLLIEKQKYIQKQAQILEEANKQLSYLNVTKDKMFSIIAHDLRNPFHTVMGFSELLMLKFNKLPKEKTAKYIQLIHAASLNGNNLLENLLHWSRSQTGKMTFEPEIVDLFEIVRQTLNFLNINAHHKNININVLIPPTTLIYADPNMILTIIRNLISNAIKFTSENGNIRISSLNLGSQVQITIEDDGIGISEESQQILFDMNLNTTTKGTNNEQGTGLGLILCKEFVERHLGKIWVESEEGKGSKFIFTLPLPNN